MVPMDTQGDDLVASSFQGLTGEAVKIFEIGLKLSDEVRYQEIRGKIVVNLSVI